MMLLNIFMHLLDTLFGFDVAVSVLDLNYATIGTWSVLLLPVEHRSWNRDGHTPTPPPTPKNQMEVFCQACFT